MNNTQRLDEAIKAVCPIDGISIGEIGNSSSVRIDFSSSATNAQKTAAQNVLNSFDWSDSALNTWIIKKIKTEAKNNVTSMDSNNRAIRASMRVVYSSIVETRQKINEIIAWANSSGANIQTLPNRTWQQVLNATRSSIDSETDPNT